VTCYLADYTITTHDYIVSLSEMGQLKVKMNGMLRTESTVGWKAALNGPRIVFCLAVARDNPARNTLCGTPVFYETFAV